MTDADRVKRLAEKLAEWVGFARTEPNGMFVNTINGWEKGWNPLERIEHAVILVERLAKRNIMLRLMEQLGYDEATCAAVEKLMETKTTDALEIMKRRYKPTEAELEEAREEDEEEEWPDDKLP